MKIVDNLKVKLSENFETEIKNDVKQLWKKSLAIIKEDVKPITFNTWFKPIIPVAFENNVLKIQVPTQFFWEWIEEHYSKILLNAVHKIFGSECKLSFTIKEEVENDQQPIKIAEPKINGTNGKGNKLPPIESNLNQRYQFSNFIKGEGNQLARATALAISDNPGETSFNPFFVYGGVGLGKTHLIQAIGNKIVSQFPDKRVLYISADDFTRKFVDAIQNHQANEFQNFYRTIDVLIIDDIQFLSGKEKTQDLFFHIFNSLHQSRKQIVLSSDKPPKELKGLDERLISRFKWGLQADIQPPDFETRVAILNSKAQEFGMTITPQIIEYISSNITSNIRELEGCLIKMLATATINSKDIDLELTRKIVKEIASDKKISLGIDDITRIVCEFLSLPENKIREKTRKKEIVFARQIAMYLSKEYTSNSLKTIGLYFGGKDHSTVIHSCNLIEKNLQTDTHLQSVIENLRSKIEMIM
jgi:chromosomal replication initiator protein